MSEPLTTTPYQIAARYVGTVSELGGGADHPFIQWCFSLCGMGFNVHDEVPWCSAFMQHAPFELGLPRSKSAAARSWLAVGQPIHLWEAKQGFDVVILKRGLNSPGPEVLDAPGHVGFFSSTRPGEVLLLGGNQGDEVNVSAFPQDRILGVRRLA